MRNDDSVRDEDLILRAHSGDRKAEELLIERYRPMAKNKSLKFYIAGGDRDDVMQEGMIGIFEAVRDYDPEKGTSFRAFAELCVNRRIISAIRKANRKKYRPLNESLSLSGTYESGSDPTGEELPIEDQRAAGDTADPEAILLIEEAVSLLKEDGVVIFSDFENEVWAEYRKGKKYREIAADLGRDPKSVDNAMQRIRQKILRQLKP
ncbi:MAG: sigma-70 family RNA polymerase sigma factor [Anaerovoracaceae bacterium]|jgi:RNA polymerase sporulation-specific sigma factor